MTRCKKCGSYAINPGLHRPNARIELCDVCFWREKYSTLADAVRWEIECADGFSEHGWGFWLEDDANEELCATYTAARLGVDELI